MWAGVIWKRKIVFGKFRHKRAQKNDEISNNLTLHLKEPEKEEQRKPKVCRRREIIKIRAEINDNENMFTQNLCDAAKAVLGRKFIAIQSYLEKQETSQINNLTLHLKQLEKEEQKNPKLVEGKKS